MFCFLISLPYRNLRNNLTYHFIIQTLLGYLTVPLIKLDVTSKYCITPLPMLFMRKEPAIINPPLLSNSCSSKSWLLTICFLHMSREIYVIVEQNYIRLTPPHPSKLNCRKHVYFHSVTLNFLLTNSASAAVPLPAIEFGYYQPFSIFSRTNLSFNCNRTILLSYDQTFSGN